MTTRVAAYERSNQLGGMAMRIQPLCIIDHVANRLVFVCGLGMRPSDRVGTMLETCGERRVAISSALNTLYGSGAVERVLANTTDRMAALHLHRRVCYGGRAVRCQLDPWIQPVRLLVKLPRGLQWWQWTDWHHCIGRFLRLYTVHAWKHARCCMAWSKNDRLEPLNFIMNALGPWGGDS